MQEERGAPSRRAAFVSMLPRAAPGSQSTRASVGNRFPLDASERRQQASGWLLANDGNRFPQVRERFRRFRRFAFTLLRVAEHEAPHRAPPSVEGAER